MPKETFYFSHDYHARSDKKMVRLLAKNGVSGVGIYWCLIEMLYEEGGYIELSESDCIASELRTKNERVLSVVNDFKLFENDGVKFWSKSVLLRLKLRNEKSEKARESVKKRWENAAKKNTTVERPLNDSYTIKESKVKDIYIPLDVVLKFFKETRAFRQLAEKYKLADLEDRFIEFYNIRSDLEFKNKTKEDIVAYFSHSLPNTLANERNINSKIKTINPINHSAQSGN